ncbi:MAG: CDP-alcohol phosphatidyltransferase family protein [Deltaproteobacteria bacterium]|nr:CDP-alcohol phosphatidyltransferase family protein [Deltaproteobacteria bacterium]
MKSEALIYVPSDTPEAMVLATRKVAGVPLIIRGVMSLAEAGLRSVVMLVAPGQKEQIERFLRRYPKERRPEVSILEYDEPYRLSPTLVQTCLEKLDSRFMLINANLLFDASLIRRLRMLPLHGYDTLLCHEGAHPLPIIAVTRTGFATLTSFTDARPRSMQSCLTHLTTTLTPQVVQRPDNANIFFLRRSQNIPVAEKFLSEVIRVETSGLVARWINKRISLPISLLLSKLWISPNAITSFNIMIGLAAAVFAADGQRYGVILLGATLYQLASIVDGCDGEVAKLTFRKSRFGQIIDTIGDNLSLFGFLIAMIGGYWRQTHSPIAFVIGAALLTSAIVTITMMLRSMSRLTDSKSLVAYEREYLTRLPRDRFGHITQFAQCAKYVVKKDGFSFLAFLFAVTGHLYTWLFLTTAGAMVAAVIVTRLAFVRTLASEPHVIPENARTSRLP